MYNQHVLKPQGGVTYRPAVKRSALLLLQKLPYLIFKSFVAETWTGESKGLGDRRYYAPSFLHPPLARFKPQLHAPFTCANPLVCTLSLLNHVSYRLPDILYICVYLCIFIVFPSSSFPSPFLSCSVLSIAVASDPGSHGKLFSPLPTTVRA